MKVTLTTKSELLSSTGESSAWIDADLKYDKYGFPFVSGKTYKGLLRESMMEVTEMIGEPKDVVTKLFGRAGEPEGGLLRFNNVYPEHYDNNAKKLLVANKDVICPGFIKSFYTTIIAQTAIDDDGAVKDKSLRKYRLLKRGKKFETFIENVELLSHFEKELLKKSIVNLRYLGLRRNRGFGEVVSDFSELKSPQNLTTSKPLFMRANDDVIQKLEFQTTLLDPIVIARVFGEQNTVSTFQYFPSHLIRGIVARLIIENEALTGKNASENEAFREIILDGKVSFHPFFINGAFPVPKAYGFDKTIQGLQPLVSRFDSNIPLKQLSGFGQRIDNKFINEEIDLTFSFHHSRFESRIEGKSTESKGGIFYYEALDENQIMKGCIYGPPSYLLYIQNLLLQKEGVISVGKAKSAQYGKVQFGDFRLTDLTPEKLEKSATILFISPVITINDLGFSIPDIDYVIQYLYDEYGITVNSYKIASSPTWVETYMGVWKSKTPREAAFDIGTTLTISFKGELDVTRIEAEGIGQRTNEGYGKVKIIDLLTSLERIENEPNQVLSNSGNFGNKLLDDIFRKQLENDELLEIKRSATSFGIKKRKLITNSLIGRLHDALMKAENYNAWQAFTHEIEGKKAHRSLYDANLLEDVKSLNIHHNKEIRDFEKQKLYWLKVFDTLRVKNDKNN